MGQLHNKKWEISCQTYVLERTTKTEAYKRGFPSAAKMKQDTVYVRASELFKRKRIQARVVELQEEKNKVAMEEFDVDATYILRRLVEVDQMDISDILDNTDTLRPVSEWPKVWRQFISAFDIEEIFAGRGDDRLSIGLLKKIKWPDKLRALEMLGKHIDVSAFKETLEHRGPGGGPIRVISTSMTPQQAAEAYADTLRNEQ